MRRMPTLLVGCLLLVAAAAAARGDDWPNWRGPSGAGVAAGGGYVASWGPQENVRWRVPLPGLGASTPVVTGDAIVVTCAVDGQDAAICLDRTGKELWRVGGLNPKQDKFFRSIASPVVAGDLVIAPYARGNTITAIRRGGAGDVTATHVAWVRNDLGADVPTPAVQGGRVYVCTDKGRVECLEAASGKTLWQGELPKNRNAYSASPVLVDGRLVVTREDGHATTLAAGDAFEVLAEGDVGEMTVATPVFVDGGVFLRTHDALWCLGTK